MTGRNRAVIGGAAVVARDSGASAILLAGWLPEERRWLQAELPDCRILSGARPGTEVSPGDDREMLRLPQLKLRRRGRAKIALLEGLASGLLNPGERVVVLSGTSDADGCELDTIAVVDLSADEGVFDGHEDAPLAMLHGVSDPAAFDALLTFCVELGHEGREGKPVGALLTLGDDDAVHSRSHPLVLNPFEGHPESTRGILSPAVQRTLREFSGMDGAFVLRSDGVVMYGGRYLRDVGPEASVPSGLGARHRAAAGITATTSCIAFCVSESTGDTRVFGGGRLLMTIERDD